MENLREAIIQWLNSQKRDFNKGLKLLKKSGYVPQVVEHIEKRGVTDPHAQRALTIELRNCLREIHKAARTAEKETKTDDKQQDTAFVGNIEKELQKEYPAVIKKTLTEFQSLYQSRSILHKELKAIGESNDEKSTNERKHKLMLIDATSRRMDILWGIFDQYRKDASLPEDTFFEEPFDPEKEEPAAPPAPDSGFVLPDDPEELKKLKENLRIKIAKAENRLEFQTDTKGEKPNPMPEGPKRAELVKRIAEMKKQKEAVEYKIVELK